MSYCSARKSAAGPTDPATARALLEQLNARFGAAWSARGWALEADGDSARISGDEGQFYLDAVANDAHAPIAMAFLARFAPKLYAVFSGEAADDLIDLDESQEIFLRGQTIEEILAADAHS